MRTSRYVKTVVGILMILAILGGIGYGISYILKNQKPVIYFVTEMGDQIEDLYADQGTVVTLPTPKPVEGYEFKGWYYDQNFNAGASQTISMPGTKTMLYARWEIKSFTFTFDYNDGVRNPAKLIRTYGTKVDVSDYAPYGASLGYDCVWKRIVGNEAITVDLTKEIEFTDNMTFKRFEEPRVFPIKFIYLNESFDEVELEQTSEVKFNTAFDIDDVNAQRNGYTFNGWKLADSTDVNNFTILDADFPGLASLETITLIGQYSKNSYKLHFTDEDGNKIKTYDIEYLSPISDEILDEVNINDGLVKNHYNLTGWQFNMTGIDFSNFTMPYNDLELAPVYTPKKYNLRFYTMLDREIELFNQDLTYNDALDGLVPSDLLIQTKIESDAYKLDKLMVDTSLMDLETFYENYTNIEGDLNIRIILNKFKLFVNFYTSQTEHYTSVQIQKGVQIALPADPPTAKAPTPKDVGSTAVFGGWVLSLETGEIFDKDYNLDNLTDDIMVYADWYEESKTLWNYEVETGSGNFYLTKFNGEADKIATPKQINIGTVDDPIYKDVYGMGLRMNINARYEPVGGLINKRLLITNNIFNIGQKAFYNVQNLKVKFEKSTYQDNPLNIEEYAFSSVDTSTNQYSVASIKLPARLFSVDEKSFYNAKDLASIQVDSGCNKYRSIDDVLYEVNNTKLKLVAYPRMRVGTILTIPANCTSIGNYAFGYKANQYVHVSQLIKVVTAENSELASIGDYAFQGNPQLQVFDATTATSLTSIGKYAFGSLFSQVNSYEQYGVFIIGKLTNVGDNAFYDTRFIKNLKLDLSNATDIGLSAFKYAGANQSSYDSELRAITIGGNIQKISNEAFNGAKVDIEVLQGNKISQIGEKAFMGAKLATAVFDTNITSIGNSAFANIEVDKLTINTSEDVTLGNQVFHNIKANEFSLKIANISATMFESTDTSKVIDKLIIDGVDLIELNGFASIKINQIIMGDNCTIEKLPAALFKGNSRINKVVLADSITEIEASAFEGCDGLITLELPAHIQKIGVKAFSGCSKMQNVDFGDALTNIYNTAFYGCSALTSIVFPETLKKIDTSAFENCKNLATIKFPNATINEIMSSAFAGTGITNLELRCGKIYSTTFANCKNLITATIINTYSLGSELFKGCTSLRNALIKVVRDPNGNPSFSYMLFAECESLNYVILDGEIPELKKYSTSIYAFHDKSTGEIRNFKIYVNNIAAYKAGDSNFNIFASNMKEATFDNGMVVYNGKLLRYYGGSTITLDNTITSIGEFAFTGCSNLTTINITATTLISLDAGNGLFTGVNMDNLVVKVPSILLDGYVNDLKWVAYKDNIQAAS